MIVLITSPDSIKNEAHLLNEMLEQFPITLHLRKPESSLEQYEQLLLQLNNRFLARIVLHQHHQLAEKHSVKGLHLTELERKNKKFLNKNLVSTAFHTLNEAKKTIEKFEYALCSPVFPSISKENYFPTENWQLDEMILQEKAVALGGVEPKRFDELKKMGFEHIALLGAVWESQDPILALKNCCELW